MEMRQLGLGDVREITPSRIRDERGFFCETYNARKLSEAGIDLVFVQDNYSCSLGRGILRGLHYQIPPRAQDKLVSVVSGAILDVAVDIRRSSLGFGKWVAIELSAEKGNQALIPKGFAHGFLTLTDHAEVFYKVTDTYSPEHDRAIRFDDPALAIDWPGRADDFQLSAKDRRAPRLAEAELFE
jgi:dTDP-4-dehydrorhamnose 3,5-epimerase